MKVDFHAVLGSYVDDAFGGTLSSNDTQLMMTSLNITGRLTQTCINLTKTEEPARSLVILGLLYCSIKRVCRLGDAKRAKYISRVSEVIKRPVTSRQLEKVVGNLGYAA